MDAIGKRGMFRAVLFVLATIVASMAGGSGPSRAVAEPKIEQVKERVGFMPPPA